MHFALSGIGTDVGKTIVSAVFCKAFGYDYWKPIQSGANSDDDSLTISALTNDKTLIHPCGLSLSEPLSPHAAANLEGITIDADLIQLPESKNLLIEMAGGLMVPLNNNGLLFSDLLLNWKVPTVLVSRHYLGSINHTLLSLAVLRNLNIPLLGIVFVGEENIDTEKAILEYCDIKIHHRIPIADKMNQHFITKQAADLNNSLFSKLF